MSAPMADALRLRMVEAERDLEVRRTERLHAENESTRLNLMALELAEHPPLSAAERHQLEMSRLTAQKEADEARCRAADAELCAQRGDMELVQLATSDQWASVCGVCAARPSAYVVIPCGHLALCRSCMSQDFVSSHVQTPLTPMPPAPHVPSRWVADHALPERVPERPITQTHTPERDVAEWPWNWNPPIDALEFELSLSRRREPEQEQAPIPSAAPSQIIDEDTRSDPEMPALIPMSSPRMNPVEPSNPIPAPVAGPRTDRRVLCHLSGANEHLRRLHMYCPLPRSIGQFAMILQSRFRVNLFRDCLRVHTSPRSRSVRFDVVIDSWEGVGSFEYCADTDFWSHSTTVVGRISGHEPPPDRIPPQLREDIASYEGCTILWDDCILRASEVLGGERALIQVARTLLLRWNVPLLSLFSEDTTYEQARNGDPSVALVTVWCDRNDGIVGRVQRRWRYELSTQRLGEQRQGQTISLFSTDLSADDMRVDLRNASASRSDDDAPREETVHPRQLERYVRYVGKKKRCRDRQEESIIRDGLVLHAIPRSLSRYFVYFAEDMNVLHALFSVLRRETGVRLFHDLQIDPDRSALGRVHWIPREVSNAGTLEYRSAPFSLIHEWRYGNLRSWQMLDMEDRDALGPIEMSELRRLSHRYMSSRSLYAGGATDVENGDDATTTIERPNERHRDNEESEAESDDLEQAQRDCPDGDPLHHHHDGCPSCWSAAQAPRSIHVVAGRSASVVHATAPDGDSLRHHAIASLPIPDTVPRIASFTDDMRVVDAPPISLVRHRWTRPTAFRYEMPQIRGERPPASSPQEHAPSQTPHPIPRQYATDVWPTFVPRPHCRGKCPVCATSIDGLMRVYVSSNGGASPSMSVVTESTGVAAATAVADPEHRKELEKGEPDGSNKRVRCTPLPST